MGETAILRNEDRTGLMAALVLHAALVAVLALQWGLSTPPAPQRMSVNLASEVGLEATAPDPVSESRAALAPTLSETPAPETETTSQPAEQRAETPPPTPRREAAREPAPTRERSRPDREAPRDAP